jgi:hypothetical protein
MTPNDDLQDLNSRFNSAMLEIYERAGHELSYWATRYLQMLRRKGGIDTARYLLGQQATSDGYQTLREAGRLDLTVEALVLEAEFAPLFTAKELTTARQRLDYFGGLADRERLQVSSDPALAALLQEAGSASAESRVALFRDRVAVHGAGAIYPLERWVAAGGSVGFATVCLEAIGRAGDDRKVVLALGRLAACHRDWSDVIQSAIHRLASR